jgi:hypothetical protein
MTIRTWTVYGIVSGEPMLVDERTFDPAHHMTEPPGPPKTKTKKSKADDAPAGSGV